MAECTYQFSCPSCSALLQAVLKQALTSVQCGECFDVFDVQMPSQQNAVSAPAAAAPPAAAAAAGEASADTTVAGVSTEVLTGAASSSGAVAEPPDAEQPGAKRMKTEGGTSAEGAAADGAMAESTDSAAVSGGGTVNSAAAAHDEDSAANLEASLQSCTAHRDRILQMLIEEPDNRNLIELRDQLTNAINQLQGTKNMVQRARTGRPAGPGGTAPAGMVTGPDGRPQKGHSSRKNKPQRCSVCGGIGHKSRTCSMAVTPNAQQMCPPVQWATAPPGCVSQTGADGQQQMYVPVGGGYVMGQNGVPMAVQGGVMAGQPGTVQMVTTQGGVQMACADPNAMTMAGQPVQMMQQIQQIQPGQLQPAQIQPAQIQPGQQVQMVPISAAMPASGAPMAAAAAQAPAVAAAVDPAAVAAVDPVTATNAAAAAVQPMAEALPTDEAAPAAPLTESLAEPAAVEATAPVADTDTFGSLGGDVEADAPPAEEAETAPAE